MKSDVEAIFTKLAKEIVINHAMKKYFDSPGMTDFVYFFEM